MVDPFALPYKASASQICNVIRQLDHHVSEFTRRQIDDRIWRWVNEKKLLGPGWRYDVQDSPQYLSSLDAAVTLIPTVNDTDGSRRMDYILEHTNGGLTIAARVGVQDPDAMEFGDCDASALTRAALVAHIREYGRD